MSQVVCHVSRLRVINTTGLVVFFDEGLVLGPSNCIKYATIGYFHLERVIQSFDFRFSYVSEYTALVCRAPEDEVVCKVAQVVVVIATFAADVGIEMLV